MLVADSAGGWEIQRRACGNASAMSALQRLNCQDSHIGCLPGVAW